MQFHFQYFFNEKIEIKFIYHMIVYDIYQTPKMTLSNKSKCQLLSAIIVVSTILMIVFISVLASSFHYVEYDEYALRQHKYGEVELDHVYTQGRYVFSPIYKFVYLSSTFQSIDILSAIFSNLGLEFDIHIVVYYRLPKENLGEIYHKFSLNYDDRITNIIKTTVKDIATAYTVDDYVINREMVENVFSERVHEQLKEAIGVDIPGLYFRLLDVTFPHSVINSSLTSAIELQNNQIQNYLQEVALIEAQTNLLVNGINLQTNYTLSSANIDASQIISNSMAESNKMITTARANGIQTVLSMLNITNQTIQTEFIRLMSILDGSSPKIVSIDQINLFTSV